MMLFGFCLIISFSCSFGVLTIDDLIEDKSWVPVIDNTRRNDVPSDDLVRLEEGLSEATRRAAIGEIDASGPVDCFGLNPVLQFAFQWMFKPMSQKKINTRFFLLSREIPWKNEFQAEEDGCSFGNFSYQNKRTVVIVHGFMSNSQVFWVNEMAQALLRKNDYNVLIVDWAGGSESWKYWRAVANTRVVGKMVAQALRKMVGCGLLPSQIHCIGHSLGSHICSFAARNFGPIGRITGLDPAEPCFRGNGLNISDAQYVDVIHTNTAVFGRSDEIGVKDFYPNGGKLMPGCIIRSDVFLDKINIVKQLEGAICSHGRSYEYFIDALRSNCKLWGRSWDQTTKGSLRALKMDCSPNACAPLGLDSIQFPGEGSYFVPTRDKTPFCIPDARASRKMSYWQKLKKWYDGIQHI